MIVCTNTTVTTAANATQYEEEARAEFLNSQKLYRSVHDSIFFAFDLPIH